MPDRLTERFTALADDVDRLSRTVRTATVRARLITLPARISRTARHARLHLPLGWPWATAYQRLFTAATGPPPGA